VPDPDRIPENRLIDAIDEAIAAYRVRHGREPVNVSHWDPSREFAVKLKSLLPMGRAWDPVAYRYSYMIENRGLIASKLGFDERSVASLVTENGSMSIVAVVNWLSARGVRKVRLVCPSYFITAYNLRRAGIQVNEIFLERVEQRYQWPERIHLGPDEALWFTNPVYNTGCYSLEDQAAYVAALVDEGSIVVIDEALALTPTPFAKECGGKRNFIGIYTPHKAICLNSFKFSIVMFHPDFDDFFDDWADVLFGGLSASAGAATTHFVSHEYDAYRNRFLLLVEEVRAWHSNLLDAYVGRIETDQDVKGHFLSVYFPHLDADLGSSASFVVRTINETGAAFIPGQRSGFSRDMGLCFRVNMAQDSVRFRSALRRLYGYLVR
jgi:histidinol-phosphate/aromatic aminotransferase/cobyric acid decarboxylase-like protein